MAVALSEPQEEVTAQEALDLLGGETASNGLAQALGIQDAENTVTEDEAVGLLGGTGASNGLALALTDPPPPAVKGPNATARWLAANYHRVRPRLLAKIATKFRMSRSVGTVEDHVQGFLLRLIERDDLAPFLAQGKTVNIGALAFWATQATCTQIRSEGTDASLRSLYGAMTERERKGGRTSKDEASVAIELVGRDEDGRSSDLYDPSVPNLEELLTVEERAEMCRAAIRRSVPASQAGQYLTLFDAMVSQGGRRNLSEVEGVNTAKVPLMVAKIRTILRDHPAFSA
jgi:hypothetical protein